MSSKRSQLRLQAIRGLPCVRCGHPKSQAAHSNFGAHGKGKGIKASDEYTIPLCYDCHWWFDQYRDMDREESYDWFIDALARTTRMLSAGNGREVF